MKIARMALIWLCGQVDLWLCLGLGGTSYFLISTTPMKSPEAGAVATLVGALVGGAAVLLGNWINRANDRRRQHSEESRRAEKVKTLIAGELVDVAAGLIMAMPIVEGGISFAKNGGVIAAPAFNICSPRNMPFTDSLSSELLYLDQSALDSLITLRSNLAITREIMKEVIESDPAEPFGLLKMGRIAGGIAHDMKLLAATFEQIAPTRKIELPQQVPELFSERLRRSATALVQALGAN